MIHVTADRLFEIWRNLSFWRRLLFETSVCVIIAVLIQLVITGASSDFNEGIFGGLVSGLLYSIIDHAVSAPNCKRESRR
jgi:hypothetical protein